MKRLILIAAAVVTLFLLTAPVPIDPVAWEAPRSEGYVGPHAVNERLAGLELLSLGGRHGPEDVVVNYEDRAFAGTEDGAILRLSDNGAAMEEWADTGGRPLGLALDFAGRLIVADAMRGLLRVSGSGRVKVLVEEAGGVPLGFTNNVDVARDGTVYFTDASSKFGVARIGAPYPASLLDLMEHGGHGRLLEYRPSDGSVEVLARGLEFANGVAVAHDDESVLVNETGAYRVVRVWRRGARRGRVDIVIANLPGFPDNLTRGLEGRYWLGLVAPRNALLDRLAPHPGLRKVVQRLPAALRPKAEPYGHLLAIDDSGRVIADLQDPSGAYPMVTAAAETASYVYVASLTAGSLGRLDKASVGLLPRH
jgi:sugar lactone lactonase YvrE